MSSDGFPPERKEGVLGDSDCSGGMEGMRDSGEFRLK